MTLAEILSKAKKLEGELNNEFACALVGVAQRRDVKRARRVLDAFYAEHFPRLARVAEKTLALFAALDYVDPGWREETCVTGGDEVNRAWVDLEKSLWQGPDAAVRGEEETNGQP